MSAALLWEIVRLGNRHENGCAIAVPPDEDRLLVLVERDSVKVISLAALLDPFPEDVGLPHWLVGQMDISSIENKWRLSRLPVKRVIPRRDPKSTKWQDDVLAKPFDIVEDMDGNVPSRALDCLYWTPLTELTCSSRGFVQACVSNRYRAAYWNVAVTSMDGELVLFTVANEELSKLEAVTYSPQFNVTEYLLANDFVDLRGVILTGGDLYRSRGVSSLNASRRFAESLIGPWYPLAESLELRDYDSHWFTGRLRCWTTCFIRDSPTCTLAASCGNRLFLLEMDDAGQLSLQWWCEFQLVTGESNNLVTAVDALWYDDKHFICCGLSGGFVVFLVLHPDQHHEYSVQALNPCPIATCRVLGVMQQAELTCAVQQEMVCTTLRFCSLHPKTYYSPVLLQPPQGTSAEEAVEAVASIAFFYANGQGVLQDGQGDLFVCPLTDFRHVYQRRLQKVNQIVRDTASGYLLGCKQAQMELEAGEPRPTCLGDRYLRGTRAGAGLAVLNSGLLLVTEKQGSSLSIYAGWLNRYEVSPPAVLLDSIFARGCVEHPLSWKLYFNGPGRQPDVRGPILFNSEAPASLANQANVPVQSDEDLVAEAAKILEITVTAKAAKLLLSAQGALALSLLRAIVKAGQVHARLEERVCELVTMNPTGDTADDDAISETLSLDDQHEFVGSNVPDTQEPDAKWAVSERWGVADKMQTGAYCHFCEQFYPAVTKQCPLCHGSLY